MHQQKQQEQQQQLCRCTAHGNKNIFRNVWSQLDGIELSLVKMKLIKIENTHTHCERDGRWLVGWLVGSTHVFIRL